MKEICTKLISQLVPEIYRFFISRWQILHMALLFRSCPLLSFFLNPISFQVSALSCVTAMFLICLTRGLISSHGNAARFLTRGCGKWDVLKKIGFYGSISNQDRFKLENWFFFTCWLLAVLYSNLRQIHAYLLYIHCIYYSNINQPGFISSVTQIALQPRADLNELALSRVTNLQGCLFLPLNDQIWKIRTREEK